jgi:hypothetical protein
MKVTSSPYGRAMTLRFLAGARFHWQPVLRIYIGPLTTALISTVRLLPRFFAAGIGGLISAHSSSVRSLGPSRPEESLLCWD